MGFFSKIWKGLKKTVKKIGKGIKSAFAKFGKFMGKIGILGQVAMFFIMPYIGAALGGAFTGVAGALATNTVGGVLGAVGQAAGKVMQFVGNTVGKVGTVFNNITKGVTDTLGNFAKTASNKMFGTTFDAAANFFTGGDSAFGRSFGGESRFANLTKDFSKVTSAINETVAESASDFQTPNNVKVGQVTDTYTGITQESLPFGQEGIAQTEGALGDLFDTLNETRIGGPAPVVNKSFTYQPSLMEKVTEGIKGIPDRVTGKISEIAADPLGYAGKGMEERFQSGVQTRLMQEAGIVEKPEYNVQNISNVAYVPSFESFGGTQQQYGAPEIMNARSFEQQVTNNPSPYGYTAFQYGNYMAQFGQTA